MSWSGFTESAIRLIATYPKVDALVPETVGGVDGSVGKSLFMDTVRLGAEKVVFEVTTPSGEKRDVAVLVDNEILDEHGQVMGSAAELVQALLNDERAIKQVMETAHADSERSAKTWSELRADVSHNRLSLREDGSGEMHTIREVRISGPFRYDQQPVNLEVRHLKDQRFGFAEPELNGHEGLVVVALDDQDEVSGAGVRFDAKPTIGPGGADAR